LGVPGSRGPRVQGPPWEVSKESYDIRHVGYQFYSVFCTENESRVATSLRFQIRLPWGGPWVSPGQGPLGRSPKNLVSKELNGIRHVGCQFYSVFSTENESRVDTSLRFQIRLPWGSPWGSLGPLGRSAKNLMI
jgi:hypothetical protein